MLTSQKAIESLDYGWSLLGPKDFKNKLESKGALNTSETALSKLKEIAKNHPINRPFQALTYGGTVLSSGASYVLILWSLVTAVNKIAAWGKFSLPISIPSMTEKEGLLLILALGSSLMFSHYNERYSMGDLANQLQSKLTSKNI